MLPLLTVPAEPTAMPSRYPRTVTEEDPPPALSTWMEPSVKSAPSVRVMVKRSVVPVLPNAPELALSHCCPGKLVLSQAKSPPSPSAVKV